MSQPTKPAAPENAFSNDRHLLEHLRKNAPSRRHISHHRPITLGERMADRVAEIFGCWQFILIQAALLALWIIINITAWIYKWDPYPFILLNLVLSFQAAFTAPVILMSQNRQGAIDRRKANHDYEINLKAELEIEQLHQKIDEMREKEIMELIHIVRDLTKKLEQPLSKA